MPASFQKIINSRLFKFIVGETSDGTPTEFSVYEEAIAQLSKPLRSLVKGDLSEAQVGCTTWKDVSKETFELFVQFAYTGDYSIPMTEDLEEESEEESTERQLVVKRRMDGPVLSDFENWARSKWDETKKVNKSMATRRPQADPGRSQVSRTKPEKYLGPPSLAMLTDNFESISFPLLAPRNNYDNTCEPAENFEPGHKYSKVLLAHASLYVLGDYWLIDSLKSLALYKLHRTLCIFELEDDNVGDIVDLAKYAYSEEGKGIGEGIGGLRGLVCQYMAINAVALSLDAGFRDLLREGGEFVVDFFMLELQRKR